jgi:hypothetical protein
VDKHKEHRTQNYEGQEVKQKMTMKVLAPASYGLEV